MFSTERAKKGKEVQRIILSDRGFLLRCVGYTIVGIVIALALGVGIG